MALREPRRPQHSEEAFRHLCQISRLRLALLVWRCAAALLTTGGFLVKYCLIGPIGMRRIWKCADAFEHLAERLRYRVR